MSREQAAQEYRISIDDVIAAIDYAAELIEQQQHRPVEATIDA